MPVPSLITDLSTTAGSNSPAGSESPALIDDYLRAHASFIAGLRDGGVNDGSIATAKLANLAVTTEKIAAANVTTAKIADANVTPAKLSTGAPTWTSGGAVTVAGILYASGGIQSLSSPIQGKGFVNKGVHSISAAVTLDNTYSGGEIAISGGSYTVTLPAASLNVGFRATLIIPYGTTTTLATSSGDVIYGDIGTGTTTLALSSTVGRRFTIACMDGSSWYAYAENAQDSSGNLLVNSGYGSLEKAYVARAWVNFNGVPASGTYGRSGTTVTVTMTAHGMTTGQVASLTFSAGTGGTATSGSYAVTVVNANTFTITDTVSGTITGSPAVTRNVFIRSSGNVSSITDNGVGDYTVNFSTSLPDANYAWTGTARNPAGNDTSRTCLDQRTTTTKTASALAVRVMSGGTSAALSDSDDISISIFR